jgi:hypothetical protein
MHTFEEYCEKTIKKDSGILFFKQKTNPLKFKTESISESLTHLSDKKIEIAIDMFEILLKTGGEKNDEFPIIFTLWKFIKIVFE